MVKKALFLIAQFFTVHYIFILGIQICNDQKDLFPRVFIIICLHPGKRQEYDRVGALQLPEFFFFPNVQSVKDFVLPLILYAEKPIQHTHI